MSPRTHPWGREEGSRAQATWCPEGSGDGGGHSQGQRWGLEQQPQDRCTLGHLHVQGRGVQDADWEASRAEDIKDEKDACAFITHTGLLWKEPGYWAEGEPMPPERGAGPQSRGGGGYPQKEEGVLGKAVPLNSLCRPRG